MTEVSKTKILRGLLLLVVAFFAGMDEFFPLKLPKDRVRKKLRFWNSRRVTNRFMWKKKARVLNAGSNTTHLRLAIQPIHRG